MPTHRDQPRHYRQPDLDPQEPAEQGTDQPATSPSPTQKQLLFQWTAPVRPFRKLDKDVFSTILAGAFLLGVILFFIDGAVPVVALASLIFLFYVLGTVPPGHVTHTITTWGVETEGKLYPWELMTRYWLQGKSPNCMLIIELGTGLQRHLRFVLPSDIDESQLHELLQQYLVEDQPKPNWLDKTTAWVESKIRLSPES